MVLDASALLALVQGEPGSDVVSAALPTAAISAVNYTEAVSKLIQLGMPRTEVLAGLEDLDLRLLVVDKNIATLAGTLFDTTRQFGLSLGDRMCIATAIIQKSSAMTADQAWQKIEYPGLDVVLIR